MYIGDRLKIARLTATGIPEGQAIVFIEMLQQIAKRQKTLKEAGAVLRAVGFTPAQADTLMEAFKAITEARGGKLAEHDFQTDRCLFTHAWSAPPVSPPLAARKKFSVVKPPENPSITE